MRTLAGCLFLVIASSAPADEGAGKPVVPPSAPKKAADAAREVAGTAEFLRSVPKHFATLQAVDPEHNRVTLLIEGEKSPKGWPLTPDAEVKVMGWWGRLGQLSPGDRVWAWFKTDRSKKPTAVFMLADEVSEQDIHGSGAVIKSVSEDNLSYASGKAPVRAVGPGRAKFFRGDKETPLADIKPGEAVFIQSAGDQARIVMDADALERRRATHKALLRKSWEEDGLPGTLAFVHLYSGESDVMLDHEAMRWARSLKPGDRVTLVAGEPVKAAVKSASPWRERTQVRLVINGLDQAELAAGQRVRLKMAAPPADVEASAYPPDIDRPRAKDERVEWFLANVYCTCKVGGDICTGHFYTLASCNPNGCGAPNATRKAIAAKIDQGLTNRQIFDDLRAERGPGMLKPHLLP